MKDKSFKYYVKGLLYQMLPGFRLRKEHFFKFLRILSFWQEKHVDKDQYEALVE